MLLALLLSLLPPQAPPKAASKAAVPNAPAPAERVAFDLTRTFGRDNAAFARGLFRQGYEGMAADFCAAFEKWDRASADERAGVRSVFLDIQLELAFAEPDLVKRKDLLSKLLKEKEQFIADYPGTTEAKEAEVAMPESYRLLGETLVGALLKVTDPDEAKALREEGSAAFAHVQDVLRKQKREVEAKLDDATLSDEATDELREQRARAWFNLCKSDYFRSQLFGADDPERERRLKQSLSALQDFSMEFDDNVLAYQGNVFQGFCEKSLGNVDAALEHFDATIALIEQYDVGEDGRVDMPDLVDDVVSWAVLQKALALAELKRHEDVIAACKDFYTRTKSPEVAQYGLAVLASQSESEIATGDTKAAGISAQTLQDLNPTGQWGAKGRDVMAKLLGGGSGAGGANVSKLGSAQLLKIADAMFAKGEIEQALTTCARALDASLGNGDAMVEALMKMGAYYAKQLDYRSAAVAFDSAWMRFPKSARAADAVYASMTCFQTINGAEKRPVFARLIEERRLKLANDYASSAYAAKIQLFQGQQLDSDQKFSEAADFFLKVQPGSANYEDAQYAASRSLVKDAQRVVKLKQSDQVAVVVKRADEQLTKCVKLLEDSAAKTLDLNRKQVWESQSFECRTLHANLCMMDGVGRAADVPRILEGVEDRFPADLDKIGVAWSLRIQSFNSLGRFDDAEKLLEALLAKGGEARSAAAAAGVFARSCDGRAVELIGKDPKSAEGAKVWEKAFRYYVISLKAKLHDIAAARSGELEQVAARYFIMGKHFNGIPDRVNSTLSAGDIKVTVPHFFEEAADTYAATLELVPSYRTRMNLARTLGFLGRSEQAGEQYAQLFDSERIIDAESGDIDNEVARKRPDLVTAYLEWGLCDFKAGLVGNRDVDRLARANGVFGAVVKFAKPTGRERSETWWHGRYWQMRAWVDQGDYAKADLALRDLERNTEDFDQGKYGLRELFRKMKSELANKVIK
ncbi:MAG: hypothetical protein EXS13_07260 [Planctomycetes bacterium]|nr:hypothetical protein [Planctomycetota bacterium]